MRGLVPNLPDNLPSRIERCKGALTAPALATLLGSRTTIYEMAVTNRLPYRIGCMVRFDPVTIAEWLRSQSVPLASWALSADGLRAYELWEASDLGLLAACERPGRKLDSGVCYRKADEGKHRIRERIGYCTWKAVRTTSSRSWNTSTNC